MAALTVQYVAQTSLVGRAPATVVAAAVGVGALVLATATTGLPSRGALAALGRRRMASAALAGALGLFLAPWLVAANRYTDAPSGTEVLFLTTACWGALLALAAPLADRTWRRHAALGALTALAGSAALLAVWEFPSSFSPFVKFPAEQAGMLLAGGCWAAFALLLARNGEGTDGRVVLWVACATGGGAGSAAAAVAPWATLDALAAAPAELGVIAISGGVVAVAWRHAATSIGVARAAALFFGPALLLTAFSVAVIGVSGGGHPMLLPQAGAACAVVLAGAAAALSDRGAGGGAVAPRRALLAAGVVACAFAAAGLLAPSIAANVEAHAGAGETFEAAWTLAGWETAGGWVAACAAMWLLAQAYGPWRAGLAAAVCAAAFPLLTTVPLHTWNRWLPSQVQQEYGTEYARIAFEAVSVPAQVAAIALAVAGLVGAVLAGALAVRARGRGEEAS